VNNACGGYEQRGDSASTFVGTRFWVQPLWRWQAMFGAGVGVSLVTCCLAALLLLADRRGRPALIVNSIAWAFGAYLGNVLYDSAQAATAWLAHDLRPHNVAAVAIAPATWASPKHRNTAGAGQSAWTTSASSMNGRGAMTKL
jgi:NAD(P)-dependent dehydrogenase (short-subunit alcohol dehydrogenase family)